MIPRPGFASQATHRGCRTRVHLWMPCPTCSRTGRTGAAEQTAPLWRPDATQHRMQNTRAPLRTRVSRAQRLSRLRGSLEEAAGQQGVVGPRHSTILVGRPGQRLLTDQYSSCPPQTGPHPTPDLTQAPLQPEAIGTALGGATEPGTYVPVPGQRPRPSHSSAYRAMLCQVRLAKRVPMY